MYKPDKRFIEGERVEIGFETTKYKILGRAFLHKNKRFSDLLNDEKGFLVLTDVKVFPLNGKEILFKKEHLIINKNSIVLGWEE